MAMSAWVRLGLIGALLLTAAGLEIAHRSAQRHELHDQSSGGERLSLSGNIGAHRGILAQIQVPV
jgi:hypothetical protein